MTPSFTADALIKKAEECYSLGLITQQTLESVTRRALSEPGYTAILELPLSHQLDEARRLSAQAARHSRRQHSRLRRFLHVFTH